MSEWGGGDPERIDIGLTLADQGGLEVMRDLTDQLSAVSRQLAEMRAPTAQAQQREARRTQGVFGRIAARLRSETASTGAPDAVAAREVVGGAAGTGSSSGIETAQVHAETTRVLGGGGGGPSRGDETQVDEVSRREQEILRRDMRPARELTSPSYRGRLREALGYIGGARKRGESPTDAILNLLPPPPGGSPSDPSFEYESGVRSPRTPGGTNPSLATERELERLRAPAEDFDRGDFVDEPLRSSSEGGGASRPPQGPGRTPPQGPGEDGGASSGEWEEPLPPPTAAERHLRGLDINEPIQIPRFGEFTTQDKLNMASDALARWGLSARRREPTSGAGRLQTAAFLNQAAVYSPYVAGIGHTVMMRTGFLRGSEGPFGVNLNPSQLQQQGAAQGYSTGGADVYPLGWTGAPFLKDIGFQAPGPFKFLTEATRQGLKSEVGYARMAERAEITNEQARTITQAIADQGWRDPQRGRLQEAATAVYQRQRRLTGMEPEMITSLMDQSLRHGTTSVNEFVEIMALVPDAAEAANVSLNEMGSAMEEMGNAVQDMGGTFAEGARRAVEFTSVTGLPAQVGTQAMQNPLVQSNIMLRTGLIPQVQGLAPTGTLTGGLSASLEQMVDIYENLPDTTVRGPGGETKISGKRQAIALAGQQLGLSPEQATKLWRGRNVNRRASQLLEGFEGYAQSRAEAERRGPDAVREFQAGDDPRSREYRDVDPSRYNFRDLERLMRSRELHFSNEEIESVREAGSVEKQRERLADLIAKRQTDDEEVREGRDERKIDLTDRAARWFRVLDEDRSEAERRNRDRNKGNKPRGTWKNPGTSDPHFRSPGTPPGVRTVPHSPGQPPNTRSAPGGP